MQKMFSVFMLGLLLKRMITVIFRYEWKDLCRKFLMRNQNSTFIAVLEGVKLEQ